MQIYIQVLTLTTATLYLRRGRDNAVEVLLPEARRRPDRITDAHQNTGERRRKVEMVDEESVVLESTERQSDRHERYGARPLSAVDEAVCRHHARRHDRT